ncbi:MAG: extracellular solute-binding protein [Clostridia bacterium]|nr:extracellular solute-binding protein [Clostridia bacterium]
MKRWSQWIQSARLGLDVRRLRAGVAWMAMLCLLALAGNAALAEDDQGLNAVCAMGEQLYLLENNALWTLDEDLQPEERIHTFTQELSGFCAYDGAFYFAFEDGGKVRFMRRTSDNRLELLFDVEAERRLTRLLVAEDRLVALWQFTPEEESQHQFINNYHPTAYTLTGEPLELPFDEAASVAASQPYGLLYTVFEATGTRLCAMDWEDGGTRELSVSGDIDAIAEAPDGAGLYYDDSDQLYRYDYATGEVESLGLWEGTDEQTELACVGERVIRYASRGDMNREVYGDDVGEKQVLTIVNAYSFDGTYENEVVRRFRQAHPDVKVEVVEIPEAQLITMLMAGETDLDILMLQTSFIPRFVESGAILDLNSDEELSQWLEQGWTGDQVFCWNGLRYGICRDLSVGCISANESLAQYVPEIDWENATWLDVFRQAQQMQTDITGNGMQDIWFLKDNLRFPMWMDQYMASFDRPEDVCFDTEEFRAVAEQYRQCVNAGLIMSDEAYYDNYPASTSLVAFSVDEMNLPNGGSFLPLPRINGCRVAPSIVAALSIPVRSAHRELALDLLKCYASEDMQRFISWGEMNWAADSELYAVYSKYSEKQKDGVARQKAYVNEAAVLKTGFGDSNYQAEQMEKYLNGEITLDELVNGLQQKQQMMSMG